MPAAAYRGGTLKHPESGVTLWVKTMANPGFVKDIKFGDRLLVTMQDQKPFKLISYVVFS